MAIAAIVLAAAIVMLVNFRGSSPCWGDKLESSELKRYEEQAKMGDATALARIQLHFMQNSDKENLKKWLIIGANFNDPESIEQFFSFAALGQLALNDKAEHDWLRDKIITIATHGSAKAATMLGEEYIKGFIMPLDVEAGKYWLRMASTKNEHAAIYSLAKLLIEKPMTASDRIEAIKLLEILHTISPPNSAYREFAKSNLEKLINENQY